VVLIMDVLVLWLLEDFMSTGGMEQT
jgi:hypothetical protein